MSKTATPPADTAAEQQITYLPVEDIRPALDNPRGNLGDLTDLANSIASADVLQPILVTPRPEDGLPPYLCVIGHRRHAAAIKAGKTTIPAIIREMDEPSRLAAMFIENAQREDLTPIEEARSLKALASLMPQREVARKVGKSQAHISKRLSLLDLPDEVQAEVDAGRLPVGDAVELARLKDDKQIREIFKIAQFVHPGTGEVRFTDVTRRVADALARQERERTVKKVTRTLRADGVTVIDYPHGGAFTSAKTGKRLGDGVGHVHVSVEEHAGEPCHAATVSPDGAVIYVCTDPDRHQPAPGDGDQPGGEEDPAPVADLPDDPEQAQAHKADIEAEAWAEYRRREQAQERAELDAAADARSAFITDLVRRKPANAITTYVLTTFVNYNGISDRAAGWLGLDGGEVHATRADAIHSYIGASLANLTRAALAIVLDDNEHQARGPFAVFLDADVRDHLAFLIGNGYEPTGIEQRGLDQADEAEEDSEPTGDEPDQDQPDDTEPGTKPDEPEPVQPGDESSEAVA